jgi:hypothetical protein
MASIQLIGKEAVLSAFDEFDADTWALFDGKSPVLSGVGADTLEAWLDRFMPGGSTAQYTLRIYDVEPPVKASTEYIAAFKFRLSDPYQGMGISGHTTKLLERIEGLEKRLEGEGEEGDGLSGIVLGWLKEPDKLETVVGAFRQLMGKEPIPDGMNPQTTLQNMAGYKVTSDNNQDNDQKLERLAAVLDKLEKRDPKLLDHLDKLSKMDALTFNLVIGKLDAL